MNVPVLVSAPRSWGAEEIEFRYNDSSSCFDNLVREFIRQFERMGEERCMCPHGEATYLREATEQDHEELAAPDDLTTL